MDPLQVLGLLSLILGGYFLLLALGDTLFWAWAMTRRHQRSR